MVSVDLATGEVSFDPTSTIKDVKVIDRSDPTPPDFPTEYPHPIEVPWPPGCDINTYVVRWTYFAKESEDQCLNDPEWHFSWQAYDNNVNYTKNYWWCADYGKTGIAVRKVNDFVRDAYCSPPWGFGFYKWDWVQFCCYSDGSPQAEFTYDPASDTFTGVLPDGTSVTFYGTPQPQCVDNDGDGHYARTATCPQGDDCDDTVYDPTVYYGAPEICDGKDNNCDGQVDEGLSTDTDGDGHYTPDSCKKPNDDCDDNDPTIYPEAIEICNGKDNDCNGQVDEGCEQCIDNDRDGYYGYNPVSCPQGDDCNDNDPTIYPGATEICDGKDNNCNGQTDERFLLGIPCSVGIGECERNGIMICSPSGTGTVCSVTPGDPSSEVCDGKDNNCNGIVDDIPQRTCYTGPSGTEGVGICKAGTQVCENGTWSTCIGEVTPQEEVCDGYDNNCNRQVDEGCCEVSVKVSPSVVWPQKTGGKTEADVVAILSKPAPSEGCNINFNVEPVTYSGGHSHHDADRPKGTVTPNSISFSEGEAGAKSAKYKSSEVAGEEKIKVKVNNHDTSETIIQVKVPGFFELVAGDGYALIGQTNTHPKNHYGTGNTLFSLLDVADAYYEEYNGTLRINDISLEWGGFFDWDVKNTPWQPPHKSHRIGKNVDVDDKTAEGKTVTERSLETVIKKLKAKIAILDEGNHLHLTFP